MDYSVAELDRRLSNQCRLGTIEQADYTAARVRVRSGDLLSDWLPWVVMRAGPDRTWWAPEVGEQVVMFAPDGEPANAVVLAALYQAAHPPLADRPTIHVTAYEEDGTRVAYDREAQHLTIDTPGRITVMAQGDVVIQGGRIRLN